MCSMINGLRTVCIDVFWKCVSVCSYIPDISIKAHSCGIYVDIYVYAIGFLYRFFATRWKQSSLKQTGKLRDRRAAGSSFAGVIFHVLETDGMWPWGKPAARSSRTLWDGMLGLPLTLTVNNSPVISPHHLDPNQPICHRMKSNITFT